MNENQINQLVAEPELKVSIINAAMAEIAKDAQQKKVDQAKRAIAQIQANTKGAVNALRKAREIERQSKANLVKWADAEAAFLKTGDIKAYAEAVYADKYVQQDFLQNFRDLLS
jgi:hypothetical protein